MKNLQYIKLFEAFNSLKLSKTLSYISPESRVEIIDFLKKISECIDFPMSEISDDEFEYLNFKKALNKDFNKDKTDQDKTKLNSIKLIKFWFDKDGKFLFVTGNSGEVLTIKNSINFIKNRSLYREVGPISARQLLDLPHGSIVDIYLDRTLVLSYIWRVRNSVWAIQDVKDGNTPPGDEWCKFGNYGWMLGGDDHGGGKLLSFIDISNDDNIYKYEFELDKFLTKKPISKINFADANFALILDVSKLKRKNKSLRELKRKRADNKMSSSDIKSMNISTYINKITVKNINDNLLKNIKDIKKIILRYLYFKYILFFIDNGQFNTLRDISFMYYDIIKTGGDINSGQIQYINKVIGVANNRIKEILEIDRKIKITLDKVENQKMLDKINRFLKLSEYIYNKVKKYKIKNINDFELLNLKFESIYSILNRARYGIRGLTRLIMDYDSYKNVDVESIDLDIVEQLIKKII